MPDQPEDTIRLAGRGVNWLVGLSGGAIGSALLKFDLLLKLPPSAKKAFLAASCCFLVSIFCGVYYAFQLYAVSQRKERLDQLQSKQPPADGDKIRSATERLTDARAKAHRFHYVTMASFGLAGLFTMVLLFLALLKSPLPPPPATQNKYLITNSQVYLNGRLSHSHTFLLNQETGEIWEMTCRKGNAVEFRRVPRTSYDGSPEVLPAEPSRSGGTKFPR